MGRGAAQREFVGLGRIDELSESQSAEAGDLIRAGLKHLGQDALVRALAESRADEGVRLYTC